MMTDCAAPTDSGCRSCQSHFPSGEADPQVTLGSIANGYRTLVVGAHDGHAPEPTIARFSSSGPTRDGRRKPDLVALGVMVLGARSAPRPGRQPGAAYTRVKDSGGMVVLTARTRDVAVPCPVCGTATAKVHGYHHRAVKDVPVDGRQVVVHLRGGSELHAADLPKTGSRSPGTPPASNGATCPTDIPSGAGIVRPLAWPACWPCPCPAVPRFERTPLREFPVPRSAGSCLS